MWKQTITSLIVGAAMFVIASTQEIVAPEECIDDADKTTPKCPTNEFFTTCKIAQCRAQNCSQLGKPIACASIIEPCDDPACVCNYGYARHDNGTCIPVDQCQYCNDDPNAQSGCSNYCGNTCNDYKKKGVACSMICMLNGCKCKPGFVYNKDMDRCVEPKDCACKKRNEVFYDCLPTCPPEGCDTSNRQYKCAAPPQPGNSDCKAGCKCKGGFYRNKAGECVPKNECEINKCKKENEEYYICSKEEITACNCENSCRCVKGYIRNKKGNCMRKNRNCPANETFVDRPPKCPGESCDVDIRLILCDPNAGYDPAGCRCNPGFCRYNGKCTTREELDSQCKENETFKECATHCGEECGVDPKLIKCATYEPGGPYCPPADCVCKPGYCRDGDGNCIKSKRVLLTPKEITPLPEPVTDTA